MGHLKNLPRAGWLLLGIPLPESVAEHSFRVGMTGIVLAALDGTADIGRTAALGIIHDAHETRIGDVPSVGRAYVSTAVPEAVTAHQASAMPGRGGEGGAGPDRRVRGRTRPSRPGWPMTPTRSRRCSRRWNTRRRATTREAWRDTSLAALRTEAGQELARAIGQADPHGWWAAFAASYHELRKSTRARREGTEPE